MGCNSNKLMISVNIVLYKVSEVCVMGLFHY